ncbi:MAG: 3-mercaptopyruvate sulfurtransferase [Rhodospirillales bacterium]|nr:3-mercaptopyruvate sulfurtransferase [Rhodospirillales bacterium]
MDYEHPEALVDCDWLQEHLRDDGIIIIDASFHLAAAKRDARAEFNAAHIPGARFFDVDEISDTSVDLPHMLPKPETFARMIGAMGIGNNHHVIAYDSNGGGMAAMRAWWMFRIFGHDKVSVLNGGLVKWTAEERKVNDRKASITPSVYFTNFAPSLVRSFGQMKKNVDTKAEQVVDVRAAGRYAGTDPEPRQNMRSGHIPGAINLPYASLFDDQQHMVLRPAENIESLINNAGIDTSRPIIASCGSGVTACALVFALYLLGKDDGAVYDGSWTEWGGRSDTPIET